MIKKLYILFKLGRKLAKKEKYIYKNSDYIVIGIPETGICSGKAYAEYLNLKYKQAIRKNPNKGRTFIILDERERKKACDQKFTYDCGDIKNKKIIIVDDTIVRGNIIKSIIKYLKKCGAREIHIRIPAPPVIDILLIFVLLYTLFNLFSNVSIIIS